MLYQKNKTKIEKSKICKEYKQQNKKQSVLHKHFDIIQSKSNNCFDDLIGDGKIDKQEIRISNFNVNGIRAIDKKNELLNYIDNNDIDILVLNELKVDETGLLQSKVLDKFKDKYNVFYNCCKPPLMGYSGVAILTKYKPISYKLDIENHNEEGRVITIEFDTFYLVGCYVPNSGQGLKRLDYRIKEWDVDFQKYLNQLSKNKNIILTGDLNVAHQEIDIKNPKGNQKSAGFTIEERKSFSELLDCGFIDTFRHFNPEKVQYSWWSYRGNSRSKGIGWRLDYFIINKSYIDSIIESIIRDDINGSDHCPIEMLVKL